MTEQDKKYVIEALEYALHKCIDVNGDSETQYNTLAYAIEIVKNCSISDVVGRSEKLSAFAKWIQENGNHMTPEKQVKYYESESQ